MLQADSKTRVFLQSYYRLFYFESILQDFENASPYFCIFLQTINAFEKLLAAFNVQLKAGMNQLFIWLYHNATLLITSDGSIQHTLLFWSFWVIFYLLRSVYDTNTSNAVYYIFLINSNWKRQYFQNKRQIKTSDYCSFWENSP